MGDGFIDFDNDGWKDIMMINGHVYPQVDEHDWGTTFANERCCSGICTTGNLNMFRR